MTTIGTRPLFSQISSSSQKRVKIEINFKRSEKQKQKITKKIYKKQNQLNCKNQKNHCRHVRQRTKTALH